jgi:hypothetical protein
VAASSVGFRVGLEDAKDRDAQLTAFESDLRKGMPTSLLVARHYRTLLPWPEDGGAYFHAELTANFSELRKRRIGSFKSLRPEGGFREVPLSEVPASSTPGGLTVAPALANPLW